MDKFIIFVLGAATMILAITYRKKIVDFTGKSSWVEMKLGPGGTYTAVILIGMLVWMGSMMYALGSFDQVLGFLTPIL